MQVSKLLNSVADFLREWSLDSFPGEKIKNFVNRGPPLKDISNIFVSVIDPCILEQDELRVRAKKNSSLLLYGKSEEYTVEKPKGEGKIVDAIRKKAGDYSLDKPFVCKLDNVTLIGEFPLPITGDKKIILEAIVRPVVLTLHIGFSVLSLIRSGPEGDFVRDENINQGFLLFNKWNEGYFHWTAENLSRLQGVREYEERTGNSVKIIVGPDLTSWQKETLEILGYDSEDRVAWRDFIGRVNSLVIPTGRRGSADAYEWIRKEVENNLGGDKSSFENSNRIYISRNDADERRVQNESELMRKLSALGFKKYELSNLSVSNQVRLFQNAEIIVAPHGAGLINIIYNKNKGDLSVIELIPEDDIRLQYVTLCSQLGIRHYPIVCSSVGVDMVGETQEIIENVERVIENRES
jgi:hypothetical protein